LIGAIVWDLITWYFGLPSSSSHALIGGLIGSGLIAGGTKAIIILGVEKTLTFMVISPMLGFGIAFAFAITIMYFLRQTRASKVNKIFGKLQIDSSAFFSLTYGANDGQKTMGIITALLIAGGILQSKSFAIPVPVIVVAASAIALYIHVCLQDVNS
jgi:inorganic phosphate transporter, PiT family